MPLEKINSVIWGDGLLMLILGTGFFLSVKSGFFQIFHFREIFSRTILSVFSKKDKSCTDKHITPFQALSTALSATMGTGNIIGVASAIVIGGAGSVFWMWVSALLGMMTVYAENYLGTVYRYQNEKGEWVGGALAYIEKGLGSKKLAAAFSVCCIAASLGMGNMAQISSISDAMNSVFSIKPIITGIVVAVMIFAVISGGIKRIGNITQLIIPVLSLVYIVFSIVVICVNHSNISSAFGEIFRNAFGIRAVGGGISGNAIRLAINTGLRRGVFSNEAGLGSAGILHSASSVENPHTQGMWGIFEIFTDTIVCCTLTALVILTNDGLCDKFEGAGLVAESFRPFLKDYSGIFVSVSIALFAFATLIGWSYCGECAVRYSMGEKFVMAYRVLFAAVIVIGAVMKISSVWTLSDIFNGLMAFPNLTAIILLSGKIAFKRKDYKKLSDMNLMK
ncbi:MAG: alanine/glycine:cation symporter family protein [Oscillospiraceae bacterium]